MPLIIAPRNVDLLINAIHVDDKLKKHLENLGITVNSVIQLISAEHGNIVVLAKGVRYALDTSTASKIFVQA